MVSILKSQKLEGVKENQMEGIKPIERPFAAPLALLSVVEKQKGQCQEGKPGVGHGGSSQEVEEQKAAGEGKELLLRSEKITADRGRSSPGRP